MNFLVEGRDYLDEMMEKIESLIVDFRVPLSEMLIISYSESVQQEILKKLRKRQIRTLEVTTGSKLLYEITGKRELLRRRLKEFIERISVSYSEISGKKERDEILSSIATVKIKKLSGKSFELNSCRPKWMHLENFQKILEEYNKYLEKENLVDYVDVSVETLMGIRLGKYKKLIVLKNEGVFLAEIEEAFPFHLEILKELTKNNSNLNVYATGDSKQAINRFAYPNVPKFDSLKIFKDF